MGKATYIMVIYFFININATACSATVVNGTGFFTCYLKQRRNLNLLFYKKFHLISSMKTSHFCSKPGVNWKIRPYGYLWPVRL